MHYRIFVFSIRIHVCVSLHIGQKTAAWILTGKLEAENCYPVFSAEEGLVKRCHIKSTRVKPRYNLTRGIWRTGSWTAEAVGEQGVPLSCSVSADRGTKHPPARNLDEGLFTYRRFFYGVTRLLAIFQRKTDEVWQEVDGAASYLDETQTLGGVQRSVFKTWGKFWRYSNS